MSYRNWNLPHPSNKKRKNEYKIHLNCLNYFWRVGDILICISHVYQRQAVNISKCLSGFCIRCFFSYSKDGGDININVKRETFSGIIHSLPLIYMSYRNWNLPHLSNKKRKHEIQNPLKLFELFKIKCSNLQGHRIITFVNELTFMKYLI
jgi:hypothetical protein